MLEIKQLHAWYGAIEALKGLDMTCESGKITCIIGSNGAGKTTLLNAICNMITKTGEVRWNGQDISGMKSRKIAQQGIVQVPEGRHIYPGLTVKENLEVGAVSWHGLFGRAKFDDDLQQVYDLFPRLKERTEQKGWSLSGGEQQMLAIGRAMMARPKLLMLDEPSMGLAPQIIDDLFEKIVELNQKLGITIVLVEQNAELALQISSYAYIIEQGRINLHGPSSEMKDDPRVLEAYLGQFAKEVVL